MGQREEGVKPCGHGYRRLAEVVQCTHAARGHCCLERRGDRGGDLAPSRLSGFRFAIGTAHRRAPDGHRTEVRSHTCDGALAGRPPAVTDSLGGRVSIWRRKKKVTRDVFGNPIGKRYRFGGSRGIDQGGSPL